MDIRTEGVTLLLDRLENGSEDLYEVLSHPDLQLWLKAYGNVSVVEEKVRKILEALPGKPEHQLGLWEERIHFGLKKALRETDGMRRIMDGITSYDWDGTVDIALKYLPEDTSLDPVMVVTVDGYNGGMFKQDTVFLSLVYFDLSVVSLESFSHEFHHMGAEYWWTKDAVIQGLRSSEDPRKKYMVDLFTYMVKEGLANAFCSPQAITKGDGELEELIHRYEETSDQILSELEVLMDKILSGNLEEISTSYYDFTMDQKGIGLPPGHFLSGRMVRTMDSSPAVSRAELISLVKDPFNFFKLYNRAVEKTQISQELLERVYALLGVSV